MDFIARRRHNGRTTVQERIKMTQASPRPKPRSSGYIPTLDGWRTVAVFGVIAFHGPLYHIGPWSDFWLHENGSLGVYLFFAISGLLICSRLLDEETKNGAISLSGFYIRRTFRILPAMTAYLVFIGILGLLGEIHVESGAWLTSIFFVNNYYQFFRHDIHSYLYTAHFWTLAVEEHFYLILPFILAFFPKARARILIALAILGLAVSLTHNLLTRHDPLAAYSGGRTEFQIYALLFPAFLAVLIRRPSVREKAGHLCRPWIVVPLFVATWVMCSHISSTVTRSVLIPFGFPVVVLSTTFHSEGWLGRFLECSPMRALGRISYSLYLWQQLFFQHNPTGHMARFQSTPWNLACTLIAAAASYFFLEKPLIRLGHRLAPPANPGHKDLQIDEGSNERSVHI